MPAELALADANDYFEARLLDRADWLGWAEAGRRRRSDFRSHQGHRNSGALRALHSIVQSGATLRFRRAARAPSPAAICGYGLGKWKPTATYGTPTPCSWFSAAQTDAG